MKCFVEGEPCDCIHETGGGNEHRSLRERRNEIAHGNLQLTGGDLGIEIQKALKSRFPKARARVDTLGYLPRGYIGVIDETDRKEAFDAGAFSAQSALTGSGSVVLHYDGHRTEPQIVPLARVAGKTRHMPDDFFAGSNAFG